MRSLNPLWEGAQQSKFTEWLECIQLEKYMRTKNLLTRLGRNALRMLALVGLCLSFVSISNNPSVASIEPCKTHPKAPTPTHGFLPPYLQAKAEEYARSHNIEAPAAAKKQLNGMDLPFFPFDTPRESDRNESYVLIYDARGDSYLPGFRARFEHGDRSNDQAANKAFDLQVEMRSFLKKAFNRDSFDNKGADLVGTVHYGWHVNNAFWNGHQMIYGDGDGIFFRSFLSVDIVGHEIFHAVSDSECDLIYEGESGALDEHLSDVFGVLLRQWHNNASADQDSWLLGEELFTDQVNGRALRDMRHPGTAYNDPFFGKDEQAAHIKDFVYTDDEDDNGGVHYNSGIPNRAFATFATAIGGKAWKTAGHIWYEVATSGKLPRNCSFQTFANETLRACERQSPKDVGKLKQAWAAVGISVS